MLACAFFPLCNKELLGRALSGRDQRMTQRVRSLTERGKPVRGLVFH